MVLGPILDCTNSQGTVNFPEVFSDWLSVLVMCFRLTKRLRVLSSFWLFMSFTGWRSKVCLIFLYSKRTILGRQWKTILNVGLSWVFDNNTTCNTRPFCDFLRRRDVFKQLAGTTRNTLTTLDCVKVTYCYVTVWKWRLLLLRINGKNFTDFQRREMSVNLPPAQFRTTCGLKNVFYRKK